MRLPGVFFNSQVFTDWQPSAVVLCTFVTKNTLMRIVNFSYTSKYKTNSFFPTAPIGVPKHNLEREEGTIIGLYMEIILCPKNEF